MPLTKKDLVDYFISGNKDIKNTKIGIEIEGFACNPNTLEPISKEEVFKLLNFLPPEKWKKIYEDGKLKMLVSSIGNITLEPGMQIEFSSSPETDLNTLEANYKSYLHDIREACYKLNLAMFAMGSHPFLSPDNIPFLGGERYSFMYNYMAKVGSLGRHMMKTTTTLQGNFDYISEEDLKKKIQVLANITPFLIYFSASSPFKEGKLTKVLSYRDKIWEDTDHSRVGMPEFFFNNNFSIEKYVNYLLDIPMYFIIRDNKYIYNDQNYTFLDFMNNKITNLTPTINDFITHASTAFPYIRIKQHLEIRGCDTMGINDIYSINALITGLIYSREILEELFLLTQKWTKETFIKLKNHLNSKGLNNEVIDGINLNNFATTLLNLAEKGLINRKLKEERFLTPIAKIIKNKKNIAENYISAFNVAKNIKSFVKDILWF